MIKKTFHILAFFLVSITGLSQENTDIQARFSTAVDYKLNKKWKLATEYRYSLENDWQKFRSSSIQIEAKYSLTKKLALSGGYRFTTSFEEDNHRFFGALEYDYKLNKKITIAFASKFQYSTNSFDPDFMNEFKSSVKMTRQKIGIEYNIPKSKFAFNSSVEMFFKLNNQPFIKYNRIRYLLGTDYNFKKFGKLGISMFYDNKYNPIKNDRIVFVTKYSFSINDFLKKRKNKISM